MPGTGVVGALLERGWEAPSLAFFDAMPRREIRDLLPGMADGWREEDYTELYREAKRQRRRLDLEDHVFLTHQRLLFRDKSYIDRQMLKMDHDGARSEADAQGHLDHTASAAHGQGDRRQPEGEDRAS